MIANILEEIKLEKRIFDKFKEFNTHKDKENKKLGKFIRKTGRFKNIKNNGIISWKNRKKIHKEEIISEKKSKTFNDLDLKFAKIQLLFEDTIHHLFYKFLLNKKKPNIYTISKNTYDQVFKYFLKHIMYDIYYTARGILSTAGFCHNRNYYYLKDKKSNNFFILFVFLHRNFLTNSFFNKNKSNPNTFLMDHLLIKYNIKLNNFSYYSKTGMQIFKEKFKQQYFEQKNNLKTIKEATYYQNIDVSNKKFYILNTRNMNFNIKILSVQSHMYGLLYRKYIVSTLKKKIILNQNTKTNLNSNEQKNTNALYNMHWHKLLTQKNMIEIKTLIINITIHLIKQKNLIGYLINHYIIIQKVLQYCKIHEKITTLLYKIPKINNNLFHNYFFTQRLLKHFFLRLFQSNHNKTQIFYNNTFIIRTVLHIKLDKKNKKININIDIELIARKNRHIFNFFDVFINCYLQPNKSQHAKKLLEKLFSNNPMSLKEVSYLFYNSMLLIDFHSINIKDFNSKVYYNDINYFNYLYKKFPKVNFKKL